MTFATTRDSFSGEGEGRSRGRVGGVVLSRVFARLQSAEYERDAPF